MQKRSANFSVILANFSVILYPRVQNPRVMKGVNGVTRSPNYAREKEEKENEMTY